MQPKKIFSLQLFSILLLTVNILAMHQPNINKMLDVDTHYSREEYEKPEWTDLLLKNRKRILEDKSRRLGNTSLKLSLIDNKLKSKKIGDARTELSKEIETIHKVLEIRQHRKNLVSLLAPFKSQPTITALAAAAAITTASSSTSSALDSESDDSSSPSLSSPSSLATTSSASSPIMIKTVLTFLSTVIKRYFPSYTIISIRTDGKIAYLNGAQYTFLSDIVLTKIINGDITLKTYNETWYRFNHTNNSFEPTPSYQSSSSSSWCTLY